VRALANPILLRAAVVLVCASFSFLLGLIFLRLLRKSITEDAEISSEAHSSLETLPLHVYNTVIQQLKQQKHELQVQSQAEQHRARTAETFSQAVLSNLSCGVLVFATNGLVKTANPAAKQILGFASTTGMSAADIFRGAVVKHGASQPLDQPVPVAEEVLAVLREGSQHRQVQAEYQTPTGQKRFFSITVSSVPLGDGTLLGAACLINDLSDLEQIRQQQVLHGEVSAEMTLRMRTSLATISEYANQLEQGSDMDSARQIGADIVQEATSLERAVSSLLAENGFSRNAAAASS